MSKPSIGILGAGRLGGALDISLRALGHQVHLRTRERLTSLSAWVQASDMLCLSVRDGQISGVVDQLVGEGGSDLEGKTVLIHSGATPLSILDPLKNLGATIGKFHPLQSFSSKTAAPIPPRTPWAIEGDVKDQVAPWVTAWEGSLHELSGDDWSRYHLAAVVAANFLPYLIRMGSRILEPLAHDNADALDWLKPLVEQSVAAGLDVAQDKPFSGPASRNDHTVLSQHRALLKEIMPELDALYREASEGIGREMDD